MNEITPSVILLGHDHYEFKSSVSDKNVISCNTRTDYFIQENLVNVYTAFRRCYKGGDNLEFLEYNQEYNIYDPECGFLQEQDIKNIENFIRKMRKSPHESPLEFGALTFSVSGVSRSFSHQWVRSRIASHCQMSQRYVNHENLDIIVPETIKNNKEAYEQYVTLMTDIEKKYNKFINDYNIPKEDARFILPEGTATAIVSKFNFRELIHIFKERCCNRTQWEYRYVAKEMLRLCKLYYPCVFENVGPKCINDRTGKFLGCPESNPCGNPPIKKG